MLRQGSFMAAVCTALLLSPASAGAGEVDTAVTTGVASHDWRSVRRGAHLRRPSDTSGQSDTPINAMMNNNFVVLSLQTKVQNVSQITQMMSNIAKTDSDGKLSSIRNMRD